jgi:hypothetical protein
LYKANEISYYHGMRGEKTYGPTFDAPAHDTRLGLWCLLETLLPLAVSKGVDLRDRNSAFRQWLEISPCQMVIETMNIILYEDVDYVRAGWIDYPTARGHKDFYRRRPQSVPISLYLFRPLVFIAY